MVEDAIVRCACPCSLLGRLGDDGDRIAPEACPRIRVWIGIGVSDGEFELEVFGSARAVDVQVLETCGMVWAKVCFGLLHWDAKVGNNGEREGLLANGREGGAKNANDRRWTEEPRGRGRNLVSKE